MTVESDIQRFANETNQQIKQVVKKLSFKIYRNITAKTAVGNPRTWNSPYSPPGYVGGRLKASLTISEGSPNLSVAAPGTTSTPSPRLGSLPEDPTIYIASNLPYSKRVLMDGWSDQTPGDMIEDVVSKAMRDLQSGIL